MKFGTLLLTVSVLIVTTALLAITGCASEPPPAPAPPSNVHLPATSASDVLDLLQNASSLRVSLSQDEIHRTAQAYLDMVAAQVRSAGFPPDESVSLKDQIKQISQTLRNCNDNNYVAIQDIGTASDTQRECAFLGQKIRALGPSMPSNTEAEIALVRACALPWATGLRYTSNGCSSLGQLYEARGSPDLALAVFQNAAKCQGTPTPEADVRVIDGRGEDVANGELINCLARKAELLGRLHRLDDERVTYAQLCKGAADLGSCETLKLLGAPVNIEQAEQRQSALQATDRADAASARAQAESDAKTATVIGALQNLAGSDPNAIVDEANRQAAHIIAAGAANDAAHAQVALRRQQAMQRAAVEQSQQHTGQLVQQSAPSPSQPAPVSQSPAANTASAPGPFGIASIGSSGCTDMNVSVTAVTKVNPDGVVVGFLTNNSNQTLYVNFAFTRGRAVETSTAGAVTVRPGQTIGGEGGGVWATTSGPSGVDSNPPGIHYSAWLQSEENAHPCTVAW